MSDILTNVKNKQKRIKELQNLEAQQIGSKEQLLKQLQDGFQVNSLDEAKEVQSELVQERDKNAGLLQKIDTELEEIIQSATASSTSQGTN